MSYVRFWSTITCTEMFCKVFILCWQIAKPFSEVVAQNTGTQNLKAVIIYFSSKQLPRFGVTDRIPRLGEVKIDWLTVYVIA